MVIRFSCPNGHNLSSPDERAGRKGKCPECGVSVQVPFQAPGPNQGGQAASNGGIPAAPGDDVIVFLCPNGHRLHGPRTLEGRPGQCPHCGVKFRVPSRDDVVEDGVLDESVEGSKILVGEIPALGELPVEGLPPSAAPAEEPLFNFNFEEPRADRGSDIVDLNLDLSGRSGSLASDSAARSSNQAAAGSGSSPSGRPGSTPAGRPGSSPSAGRAEKHPLAELFMKLWDEKAKGAFVEVHLADGVVLVPERFARHLSQRTHGVFAVKDPDGTHTLTVVSWDAVSRVSVRRVGKLPKGMFD
jgi:hypothetical protein